VVLVADEVGCLLELQRLLDRTGRDPRHRAVEGTVEIDDSPEVVKVGPVVASWSAHPFLSLVIANLLSVS
jgi:hypothetical protein